MNSKPENNENLSVAGDVAEVVEPVQEVVKEPEDFLAPAPVAEEAVSPTEPVAAKESVDVKTEANADFDKELIAQAEKEGLTYICDYCGEINQLSAVRCVRCGKRRPRNEYIKAMKNVRSASAIKDSFAMEKAMEADELKKAQDDFESQKLQLAADRRQARNQEVVRLVEERVADEMAQLKAQEAVRIDQERDLAQKIAARDAVMRIVMAERRAEDAIDDNKKNTMRLVEAERERAKDIAAEELAKRTSEIERAAADSVAAVKKQAEDQATQTILLDRDNMAKMTARTAVMQIIAAEQKADKEITEAKDNLGKVAVRRMEEEIDLAHKEEEAKNLARLQGITQAADERIRANEALIKKLLDERNEKKAPVQNGFTNTAPTMAPMQGNQYIQPMVIVPYVNANQPVLQYSPNQVYRFVPNTYSENQQRKDNARKANQGYYGDGVEPTQEEIDAIKAQKKTEKAEIENDLAMLDSHDTTLPKSVTKGKAAMKKTRISAILTLLSVIGMGVLLAFLTLVPKTWGTENNGTLIMAFATLFIKGINTIFGTSITALSTNGYVDYITTNSLGGGILVPLGLVATAICGLILIIRSIVRIAKPKASSKGLLLPIFGIVFSAITALGVFLAGKNSFDVLLGQTTFCAIIFFALNVLALVFTLITPRTETK